MRIAKLIQLPFFLGIILFANHSLAQEPSVTTETYGSWTYRCSQIAQQSDAQTSAKKACELVQVVRDGKGNVIAQIAFGRDPDGENKLIAVVQVPQGTLLTRPVTLSDEARKNNLTAPYFSCFNNICLARTDIEPNLLSALGVGDKGQLEFADRTGRIVRVLLSFEGLKAASDRLMETAG
ncbi:MAG: invasion associated locus B family protein [Rhizobiaceae bacterium]|nr:invasion associated locus B family protein [Rhizobiaceae bacterium]